MFEDGIKYQEMIDKYNKNLELEKRAKEEEMNRLRVKACKESYIEYEGINIFKIAMEEVQKFGFKKDFGSKCIAEVVEFLFYERKVIDKSYDLYNFDIERNNHYYFLDYGVNRVIEGIKETMSEAGLSKMSKNYLYYKLLDNVVKQAELEKAKLQESSKKIK